MLEVHLTIRIDGRGSLYDFGLAALCIAFIVILMSKQSISPLLYTPALFLTLIAICVVNTFREAHKEAKLDEVQLAAASFGARWSVAVPITIMMLMLFLTPLQNATMSFAEALEAAEGSPAPPILRVFVMGMALAVVLQLLGKSLIAAIWTWRKR